MGARMIKIAATTVAAATAATLGSTAAMATTPVGSRQTQVTESPAAGFALAAPNKVHVGSVPELKVLGSTPKGTETFIELGTNNANYNPLAFELQGTNLVLTNRGSSLDFEALPASGQAYASQLWTYSATGPAWTFTFKNVKTGHYLVPTTFRNYAPVTVGDNPAPWVQGINTVLP
jgi:hypothetical protein